MPDLPTVFFSVDKFAGAEYTDKGTSCAAANKIHQNSFLSTNIYDSNSLMVENYYQLPLTDDQLLPL